MQQKGGNDERRGASGRAPCTLCTVHVRHQLRIGVSSLRDARRAGQRAYSSGSARGRAGEQSGPLPHRAGHAPLAERPGAPEISFEARRPPRRRAFRAHRLGRSCRHSCKLFAPYHQGVWERIHLCRIWNRRPFRYRQCAQAPAEPAGRLPAAHLRLLHAYGAGIRSVPIRRRFLPLCQGILLVLYGGVQSCGPDAAIRRQSRRDAAGPHEPAERLRARSAGRAFAGRSHHARGLPPQRLRRRR